MLRKLFSVVLLLVAFVSCSRDPNVVKRRYLENGNKYYDRGKYNEASIMYRNAIKKDARFGEAYYRMALTFLKLNQPVQAVGDLRRAVELLRPDQPERAEARVKLAELYLAFMEGRKREQVKELIEEVTKTSNDLLKADPKSFDGRRLRGRLLLASAMDHAQKGNSDPMTADIRAAIAEFRQANSAKPNEPDVVLFLCRALVADRQFDEADKLYRALIAQKKDYLASYNELYRLVMLRPGVDEKQRPIEGEAVLKLSIANNPKEYSLLISLAQHYYAQKRRDEVVKVLEQLKSKAKEYNKAYEAAGAFYYRLGDGAEAIRQYEEGIRNDASNKTRYQKLIIEVLMAQGKREEARKLNETILKQDPKDNDALGLQASLLLEKGDLQNAVNQLQTVVLRAPENFVAHFNLGRGLMEKGEIEGARREFSEAIRLRPDYTAARLALGQLQLSRRENELALKSAEDIIQFEPNSIPARLIKTAAQIGLANYSQAREGLGQILSANPSSQDGLFQFGLLNMIEKRYKEAEEAYRKCYDLNQGSPRGLMGQIEVIMAQQQPDRAMEVLRAEMQKYPARLEYRVALGNVAVRAGKLELAENEFTALTEKFDRKSAAAADVFIRLGETRRKRSNLNGAIDAMQKAREILPNNALVISNLAILLDGAQRRKEAREAYEAALRIEAENPIALNNLAYIIATTPGGDLDHALTLAQRAKQKLPQVAEISDTVGLIYLKKNLSDNAIEIFRDCVSKVPKHPTYRYHLGMAYHQKGDKFKAKQELQTALSNKPFTKEEEQEIKELLAKI
ncbi:MAG: tetratricopeptide repeat protein [Bryobacteraceae bacterium]